MSTSLETKTQSNMTKTKEDHIAHATYINPPLIAAAATADLLSLKQLFQASLSLHISKPSQWPGPAGPSTAVQLGWNEVDGLLCLWQVSSPFQMARDDPSDKMSILNDSRVEVFISPPITSHETEGSTLVNYFGYEMNRSGRALDFSVRVPKQFDYDWRGSSELLASIEDSHTSTVIMLTRIPLEDICNEEQIKLIIEFASASTTTIAPFNIPTSASSTVASAFTSTPLSPRFAPTFHLGLYRGEVVPSTTDFIWQAWIDPCDDRVDFHRPETFGRVTLLPPEQANKKERVVEITNPTASTQTILNSSIPLVTPTSLFRDGIHSIFAYLSQSDWWNVTRVCRAWSEAAASEPNRQLSVPIRKNGTIRMPHNYRFRSFIVHIFQQSQVGPFQGKVRLSVPELMTLAPLLPNLQILICTIPMTSTDLSDSHRWSRHLLDLSISLDGAIVPNFFHSIFELTSLTALTITGLKGSSSPFEWARGMAPWMKLSQLEYLEVAAGSLTRIGSSQLQVQFPSHLRVLLLCNYGWAMSDLPLLFGNLDHIQHFHFEENNFRPGDFAIILRTLPGLVSLTLNFFPIDEFKLITQFQQVREIIFEMKPLKWTDFPMTDQTFIGHLAACPALTHLTLEYDIFHSIDSWQLLVTSLTQLRIIRFTSTYLHGGPSHDSWSHIFPQLTSKSLTRLEVVHDFFVSFETFVQRLGKCTFGCQELTELVIRHRESELRTMDESLLDEFRHHLPRLESLILKNVHDSIYERACELRRPQMKIGLSEMMMKRSRVIRTDRPRRLVDVETHPPAPRLVGIETNPGPEAITSSSIPSITAGTLFRDGIHSIFAYLLQVDWLNAICVCRTWSAAAVTEPNRQLSLPVRMNGTMQMPPNYRFRSFIVEIFNPDPDFRDDVRLSAPALVTLADQLPNLQRLACIIDLFSSDLSDSRCWSHHLLDLSISLDAVATPHLFQSIFQLSTLTALTVSALFGNCLTPWNQLSRLEYLSASQISLDRNSSSTTPIQFPSTLRVLWIRNSNLEGSFRNWPLIGHLDHLQHFAFENNRSNPGEMTSLSKSMPGLISLTLNSFAPIGFDAITQFAQLREITFDTKPAYMMADHAFIGLLATCPSLTHLTLGYNIFDTTESWQLLVTSLTQLQIITFITTSRWRPSTSGWRVLFPQLISSHLRRLELTLDDGVTLSDFLHELAACNFGCQELEELVIFHSQAMLPICEKIISDEDYELLRTRLSGLKSLILKHAIDSEDDCKRAFQRRHQMLNYISKKRMNRNRVIDMKGGRSTARSDPLTDLTREGIEPNPGPFNSLPLVLTQLVCQCLDISSILCLGRSNHQLYGAVDSDFAWQQPSDHHTGTDCRRLLRRIVLLDSTHMTHLCHPSLIQSHASIHYDLCHDSSSLQQVNYDWIKNRVVWKLPRIPKCHDIPFNIEAELKCLSQVRHLKSLVIGGAFRGMRAAGVLKQLCVVPAIQTELEILVLGMNEPSVHEDDFSGCPTDPCLDLFVFETIVAIASITQLSLNSSYYCKGQIELLQRLPLLHSLHLSQEPKLFQRSFNLEDLCTIGAIPRLTSLSLMIHHTPTLLVRLLQQPRLKTILTSLTISRETHDYIGGLEGFATDHLLEAFDGFDQLTTLNLFHQKSQLFHHCLLQCLSFHIDADACELFGLSFDSAATTNRFLPSLLQLSYHDVFRDYLPHPFMVEQFLLHNDRTNLSLMLHTHSPPLHDDVYSKHQRFCQESFGYLVKYSQFTMPRFIDPIPNCHIRRLPNLNVFDSGVNILRPLTCLGWLPTMPNLMTAIRTEFGEPKESSGLEPTPEVIPPAAQNNYRGRPVVRLVGIELNPGPVAITPGTLFKDAISIIYSYLSITDWVSAFSTCRHFYSVASGERCRHISFPIKVKDDVLLLPSQRLVHHFTSFHHHPDPTSSFKRVSHLLTLMLSLPHLNCISVLFNGLSLDDVNWERTNINWPKSLSSLTIHCDRVDLMIQLVQSVKAVPQLSQLTILPFFFPQDVSRFLCDVVLSFSHRVSWSNLIGQLTQLNLFDGREFTRMIPPQSKWPKLQRLELSRLPLQKGDLKRIHTVAPNLIECAPHSFSIEDFSDVALFQSLQTIRIDFRETLHQESLLTSTLIQLPHLTNVQLPYCLLLQRESWSELSSSHLGGSLTHLEACWHDQFRLTLDVFHPFRELRSLMIHMKIGVRSHESKAHFNSCDVLPNLRRLVLMDEHAQVYFEFDRDLGINVNNYRLPTPIETDSSVLAATVPATRLVGIELNPGPAAHVRPQFLFTSGLHSIFAYLDLKSWIRAFSSCKDWYSSSFTQPCQRFILQRPQLTFESITPRLRFHLIGNDPHKLGHIFSLNEFIRTVQQFPSLTSLNALIYNSAFQTHPNFTTLPAHLTELSCRLPMDRNTPLSYQPVIDRVSQLSSLRILSLQNITRLDLTPLKSLSQLTCLMIKFDTYHRSVGEDEGMKYIHLIRLLNTKQLTHLSLFEGDLFPSHLMALAQLQSDGLLPNLTSFDTSMCFVTFQPGFGGYLEAVLAAVPKLHTISTPYRLTPINLNTCAKFQHLTSLSFIEKPKLGVVASNVSDEDAHLLQLFLQCSNLTHIGFGSWMFTQLADWGVLFQGLPFLNSLRLSGFKVDPLKQIPIPLILKHLNRLSVHYSPIECESLKTILQSPSEPHFLHLDLHISRQDPTQHHRICVLLEELKSDYSKVDFDQFRLKTQSFRTFTHVQLLLPVGRLVGIEVNPGPRVRHASGECRSEVPLSSTPAAAVHNHSGIDAAATSPCSRPPPATAQTLFKDGLLIIFTFLLFQSLSSISHTCQSWLAALKQERSRGIILTHRAVDSLAIPHRSYLAHHITSLVFESSRSIRLARTLAEFLDVMKRLPGLQTCCVKINDSTVSNELISLPSSLTDLRFFSSSMTREGLTAILRALSHDPDGAPRLKRLEIDIFAPIELDLSPLQKCMSLTYLSIKGPTMLLHECPVNGTASSYYRSLITDIAALQNLIELNFFIPGDAFLELILSFGISLPQLHRCNLTPCRCGLIQPLLQFVPNIEELTLNHYRVDALPLLAKFNCLNSLKFTNAPVKEFDLPACVNLLPYLVNCSQLTHLQVVLKLCDDWTPRVPSLTSLSLQLLKSTDLRQLINTWATQIKQLQFNHCDFQRDELSLLRHFTACTDLTLDPQSFGLHACFLDRVKDRFADPSFMPQLARLHIFDRYDCRHFFTWDQVQKINIETYRLPTMVANFVHTAMSEPDQTGGLGGEATSDEASPPLIVPSPRLVGIETNPGPPIESNPITSIHTVSPPIQPGTLFRDGIHSIFAYLPQSDWWSAIRLCRTWFAAADTEPNRQLSVPIQTKRELMIRMPSNYRFRSFIVDIFTHDDLAQTRDAVQLSVSELVALADQLPNLQILVCTIPSSSTDLSHPTRWSHRLLHLNISLDGLQVPNFFDSVFELTSLTALTISSDSGAYGHDQLAPVNWCEAPWTNLRQLEYLELSSISFCPITACQAPILFPSTLRVLQIRNRDWGMKDLPLFGHLDHMQHFSFDNKTSLLPGDLPIILNTLPGLVRLQELTFSPDDFEMITQFKELRELTFSQKPYNWSVQHAVKMADHTFISHLALCPALTHLTLEEDTLTSIDSWHLLSTSLPQLQILTFPSSFLFRSERGWSLVLPQLSSSTLVRLELVHDEGIPMDTYLQRLSECPFGCQQLEELVIRHWHQSVQLSQSTLSDDAHDRFRAHLPHLTQLIFKDLSDPFERECDFGRPRLRSGTKMRMNSRRVIRLNNDRQSPATVPHPRLIGIETNPGPPNPLISPATQLPNL